MIEFAAASLFWWRCIRYGNRDRTLSTIDGGDEPTLVILISRISHISDKSDKRSLNEQHIYETAIQARYSSCNEKFTRTE